MKLYHENGDGVKVVSWSLFIWVIGFLLSAMAISSGTVVTIDSRLTKHNEAQQADILIIRTQLSQIQADLSWLKNNLK
jgi:hypothetical protein